MAPSPIKSEPPVPAGLGCSGEKILRPIFPHPRKRTRPHCFLAQRYAKKQKDKAGRGIYYNTTSSEIEEALQATRLKEWNWRQFKAAQVVEPEHVSEFIARNRDMEVLLTRWLEMD